MANNTIRELYDICSDLDVGIPFTAGVELEVESIKSLGDKYPHAWNVTEDGSLRNSGKEFISPPYTTDLLIDGFKNIHASVIPYKEYPKFSDRTSIHVHVNMLDKTMKETKSFLLWYAVFEPVFFQFCNYKRRNNIHCVPLDQTTLSEHYGRSLSFLINRWHKYTAFNMLPLKKLGTIEFRHMEGHDDAEKFEAWLKTLANLTAYATEHIMHEGMLKEASLLAAFDAIFKDSPLLPLRSNMLNLCANNILDVKLSFV